MIVTVTPNPALDRTLELDRLAIGELNRATAAAVEPSGKGVNVTRALTANGVPSLAVLACGGAEGAQLIALLDAEGVRHVAVPIAEPNRVNISVLAAGVDTKLNEPGPRLSAEEQDSLLAAIERHAEPGRWVVGSGTLPAGLDADFYARAGERVRAAGGRFALDSSGPALRNGLAGRPALVKPNLTELAELAGGVPGTLGEVIDAAERVRATTGGAVLVSLGAHGAVLVDGKPPVHAHAAVADVRSAVGAGDNLLAGFLAGAVHPDGGDRERAAREAAAWASVAVRVRGSLARPVTDADRAAVDLDTDPDPGRPID